MFDYNLHYLTPNSSSLSASIYLPATFCFPSMSLTDALLSACLNKSLFTVSLSLQYLSSFCCHPAPKSNASTTCMIASLYV